MENERIGRARERPALYCKCCGTAGIIGAIVQDCPFIQVTCQPCALMWKINNNPKTRRILAARATPAEPTKGFLDQAWREISDTMADKMLNPTQKKAFVIAILKGQLANPPKYGGYNGG